jgi:hypothetical protein
MRSRLPAIAPLAAAATTTASVAAESTASTAAILFGPGFVYVQSPAVQVAPVESGNSVLSLSVVAHFHKSKTTSPAGVAIGNQVYTVNRTELLKHSSEGVFCSVETKVSNENIFHSSLLSEICRAANAGRIPGLCRTIREAELAGLTNYT